MEATAPQLKSVILTSKARVAGRSLILTIPPPLVKKHGIIPDWIEYIVTSTPDGTITFAPRTRAEKWTIAAGASFDGETPRPAADVGSLLHSTAKPALAIPAEPLSRNLLAIRE